MSGSLTVVVGVVGALVLYETVLPRAFAALRKRLREQAKAAGEKKNANGFAVRKVGEMACGYDGPSGLRHNAISPRLSSSTDDATLAFSDCGVGATEKIDNSKVASSLATSENAKSAYRVSDLRSNEADADRFWEDARGMAHSRTPDFTSDWRYMSLLHKAAKLGHAAALSKIGDYAYRRGAFVEAFYWKWKAETNGWKCCNPSLDEIRMKCVAKNALSMPGGLSAGYGPEEGGFARAVLAILSGQDEKNAREYLTALAERGIEEARLFLGK